MLPSPIIRSSPWDPSLSSPSLLRGSFSVGMLFPARWLPRQRTCHSSHVSGCRSAQRVQNRDSAPASERRRAAPGPPFFYRHSISSRIVRSRGSTKYVLLSRSIYRYSRSVGDSRWTSSGKDRISTESGNRSPTRTRVEAALLPVVRCSVRGCSARERACLRMTSRSLSEKVVLRDAGAAAVDCDAGAAALDRPARGSTSTIL